MFSFLFDRLGSVLKSALRLLGIHLMDRGQSLIRVLDLAASLGTIRAPWEWIAHTAYPKLVKQRAQLSHAPCIKPELLDVYPLRLPGCLL